MYLLRYLMVFLILTLGYLLLLLLRILIILRVLQWNLRAFLLFLFIFCLNPLLFVLFTVLLVSSKLLILLRTLLLRGVFYIYHLCNDRESIYFSLFPFFYFVLIAVSIGVCSDFFFAHLRSFNSF